MNKLNIEGTAIGDYLVGMSYEKVGRDHRALEYYETASEKFKTAPDAEFEADIMQRSIVIWE